MALQPNIYRQPAPANTTRDTVNQARAIVKQYTASPTLTRLHMRDRKSVV